MTGSGREAREGQGWPPGSGRGSRQAALFQGSPPERGDRGEGPAVPLAERLRPRELGEFVGQEEVIGPGSPLRRAIEAGRVGSLIFYGPPGSGKTTLARLIVGASRAHGERIDAVSAGVADLRRVIAAARARLEREGQRTMLLIDEIHRFNKAQQDALLPAVEEGTVVLLGCTTENPFFYVNGPLLSRCRLFRLRPLSDAEVDILVGRALRDPDRGIGHLRVELEPAAREHLVRMAGGDARAALGALELAVEAAVPGPGGTRRVDLAMVEAALQQRRLPYDREGDEHYDVASAFIKSLRGSDPDAAVYWMVRMLEAGEDPRFVARRLVIAAAEDVGNADPRALLVAVAAADAVERIGLPEAEIPLAQAVLYVATAPKSNAAYRALNRVKEDLRREGPGAVPLHLRDRSYPGARRLGHGEGYRYPHDYPDHYVVQQYLPDKAVGRRYYQPSDQGYERVVARRLSALERLGRPGQAGQAQEPPG